MKRTNVIIGIVVLVLVVLGVTNPSEKDHKNAVMEKLVEDVNKTPVSNKWEEAGRNLGILFAEKMVDGMVERNNYLVFSTTEVSFGGKTKVVGYGVLGKVYLGDIKNNE